MLVVLVAGHALLQVAVHRHRVEQVLQVVAVAGHGGMQVGLAVLIGAVAQVVGFPVEHVKAPLVLEHQIDEAAQVALERVELECGHRVVVVAHRGGQIAGDQVARGQVEFELDQPAVQRHVGQREAAGQRRVQHVAQHAAEHRRQQRGGVTVDLAGAQALRMQPQSGVDGLGPSLRISEVGALEHGVHAFAGHRPAGETQDVVVWRVEGRGRRQRCLRGRCLACAQIVVDGSTFVLCAVGQAAVAADPPGGGDAARRG